jgi:RNA polymerase sigma-70 factor (ECF subfamily)
MDEMTREVMYLRLTGELSFAEIGDILGKTENWARVTFYRGKQKIVKGWDE